MKRKGMFIAGIIIMLIGAAIFIYPIVTQAITAHQQKVYMQQVKEEILQSINESNSMNYEDTLTETANDSTQVSNVSDNSGSTVSSDETTIADNTTDDTNNTSPADTSTASQDNTSTEGNTGSETADNSDSTAEADLLLGELEENAETVEEETIDKSKLEGQRSIGIITIEKIGIVYAIVQGVEKKNISYAIGHFPDSAGIGQEGNCSMAGHSGGHLGKFFKDLKDLVIGDSIVLTDLKGNEYLYSVTEVFICEPTDVYVVKDLGVKGKYLTLVTCTANGTKRLIVRAQCTTEPTTMKGVH